MKLKLLKLSTKLKLKLKLKFGKILGEQQKTKPSKVTAEPGSSKKF